MKPRVGAFTRRNRTDPISVQRLLRAMVIAAATGYGGRQADVIGCTAGRMPPGRGAETGGRVRLLSEESARGGGTPTDRRSLPRALVHASRVSSILSGLLAHHHRRREAPPPRADTERTPAPIHPQSLARAMGSAAQSLAAALDLKGAEAERRWRELAGLLTHLGKDPNWHNRPSILDQLRGWRITPGRPRTARTASLVRLQATQDAS